MASVAHFMWKWANCGLEVAQWLSWCYFNNFHQVLVRYIHYHKTILFSFFKMKKIENISIYLLRTKINLFIEKNNA